MELKYSTCLFKCPNKLTVYDYLIYISTKDDKKIPEQCKDCFNLSIIEEMVEDTKDK